MVKITKVYTRKGDQGSTTIAGQNCMAKNAPRMVAIGGLDELNSYIGFASVAMEAYPSLSNLLAKLIRIQHELFNLGSQLAVLPKDRRENTPMLKQDHITRLESEIDLMNKHLPVLKSFILPGGGEVSARLHLARSVCRRVERSLVRLQAEDSLLDGIELPFINRLSDWLFVAARSVTYQLDKAEILWDPC